MIIFLSSLLFCFFNGGFAAVISRGAATGSQAPEWPSSLYDGFDVNEHDVGFDENFDPHHAEIGSTINCWGIFPTSLMTIDLSISRSPIMAQDICAKPQAGGNMQLHIGGWCLRRDDTAEVVFDPSEDATPNRQLDALEVKFFCKQHCACDYWSGFSRGPQLVPHFKDYRVESKPQNEAHVLVGRHRAMKDRKERPIGTSSELVDTIAIKNQKQAIDPRKPHSSTTQLVAAATRNRIFCPGSDLPVRLPTGWSVDDFQRSTQRFCASVFNGGNPGGNLGGYCAERWTVDYVDSYEPADRSRVPWFSESWIPHPDFMPAARRRSDRYLSVNPMGYQFWCYARCTCEPRPLDSASLTDTSVSIRQGSKTWQVNLEGGGISVVHTDQSKGKRDRYNFIHSDQPGYEQKQCVSEVGTGQTCNAIAAVPPYGQPEAEPEFFPSPFEVSQNPTPKRCTSPSDCATPAGTPPEQQEVCMVKQAVSLAGNAIAFCVSVFALNLMRSAAHKSTLASNLLGRDLVGAITVGCACNATYASFGCCSSLGGVILEDSSAGVLLNLDLNESLRLR